MTYSDTCPHGHRFAWQQFTGYKTGQVLPHKCGCYVLVYTDRKPT